MPIMVLETEEVAVNKTNENPFSRWAYILVGETNNNHIKYRICHMGITAMGESKSGKGVG